MAIAPVIEIRYVSPKGVPDWYTPGKVSTKIKNVVRKVISEHRKDIGKKYPPASVNSDDRQYPRKRTGKLQRSVSSKPTVSAEVFKRAKNKKIEIGYDEAIASYWRHLYYGAPARNLKRRRMLDKTTIKVIDNAFRTTGPDRWVENAAWAPVSWRVV